jgi:hypothetical protein
MNATKTLQRALAAGVLLAAALSTSAQAYDQNAARAGTSARCEQARLSAWFDRQRQLTDGDTDPYKAGAEPAECAAKSAATGAREALAAYDSSRANATRSSDAMSDTAQYSMPARRQ